MSISPLFDNIKLLAAQDMELLKNQLRVNPLENYYSEAQLRAGGMLEQSPEAPMAPTVKDQVSISDSARSSDFSVSGGVMSNNFYNRNYQKSHYVQSRLDSFEQESSYNTRMMGLIESLGVKQQMRVMEIENRRPSGMITSIDPKYVASLSNKAATENEINRFKSGEVTEESKKTLKASRDRIEEQTQEALAPKDANGEPIPAFNNTETAPPIPAAAQSQAAEITIPAAGHTLSEAQVNAYTSIADESLTSMSSFHLSV